MRGGKADFGERPRIVCALIGFKERQRPENSRIDGVVKLIQTLQINRVIVLIGFCEMFFFFFFLTLSM